MMRLWVNSYARSAVGLAVLSATISVCVHTGVIAAWIYATMPDTNVPSNSIANRVYFIPPRDRAPGQQAVREAIHYIDLTRLPAMSGDGPRMMGDMRPAADNETIATTIPDSVPAPPVSLPVLGTHDSVFSILEVDSAVVRSANSAAPAYPPALLDKHIMGYVSARYVVDTTGSADTASFEVMNSTNPEFIAAVRDALPRMRFKPAKIGETKVRQLVEQMFTFRINDSTVAEPRKQRPSRQLFTRG